ncbi:11671_t:CDS:2 [Funneliformis geosporum]|nr:11671_t:CDS:2 [Funneliformis geosporum]
MTCRHENIYWEDFFKSEKQNNYQYRHKNAYCMDCDAKKVREWLKSNGLTKLYTLNNEEIHSYNDFEEFIDNNNYRKQKKIKRLEQKTNRTPEEEQELENLRTKLRELENSQEIGLYSDDYGMADWLRDQGKTPEQLNSANIEKFREEH